MRLRKLIVLGALAVFLGGMSSCSKKMDNATTDSTTAPPAATAPTTAPPPPAPDTAMKTADTTAKAATGQKTDKTDMKMTDKKGAKN